MVETNKFKKGVQEVVRLSRKFNLSIGTYITHYLTKEAQFMVQLSNGTLEVGINLARDCEEDAENVISFKLQEVAFSYKSVFKKRKNNNGDQWKQVFRGRR